jgi:hypothetical protein
MIAQILLAWVYGHIFEYLVHRYLLHNHKYFRAAFRNHFRTHHKIARKNNMYDVGYKNLLSSKFEVLSLTFAAIIHLPLLWIFPYAYGTLVFSLLVYYIAHRKSHTDVEWGKKWMPWHYSHHMGKDQHTNWGVRLPVVDYAVNYLSGNKPIKKHI